MFKPHTPRRWRSIGVAVALGVALVGCTSGGTPETTSGENPTEGTTGTTGDGPVETTIPGETGTWPAGVLWEGPTEVLAQRPGVFFDIVYPQFQVKKLDGELWLLGVQSSQEMVARSLPPATL